MLAKFKDLKYFNLIFNSISDMVFMISCDRNGGFSYVMANQSAIDNLNFPTDFAGKKIEELMRPIQHRLLRRCMKRHRIRGK